MNSTQSREHDASDRLFASVQELFSARDRAALMEIACRVARRLVDADGAVFALREETHCHYAEEDAPEALWKGRRFDLEACVGGWVMIHRQPAVVEDVGVDPRARLEGGPPTFVKGLAMAPVGAAAPVAVIGVCWTRSHRATGEQLRRLRILADSVGLAMENIARYADLERRLASRARELEQADRELERFVYSIAHDLQAPLSTILGYASMLAEDYGRRLPADGRAFLDRIQEAVARMTGMIKDLLKLSRAPAGPMERVSLDLSEMAAEILARHAAAEPGRKVAVEIRRAGIARADAALMRLALEHLLDNAWKFTGRTADACIEFGYADGDAGREFFVRDNGAGFDEARARRLFLPFQRLHAPEAFPGAGVGLATVRRIFLRHGGDVRATGRPGQGATFFFTLPDW